MLSKSANWRFSEHLGTSLRILVFYNCSNRVTSFEEGRNGGGLYSQCCQDRILRIVLAAS